MDKYLTTKEASDYIGYSEGYIRLLCRRGLLPHTQMADGGKILFSRQALDDLMNEPRIQIRAGGISSMSEREYNSDLRPGDITDAENAQYISLDDPKLLTEQQIEDLRNLSNK